MKFLISLILLLSSILLNSYSYQNILESSLNNYSYQEMDNFDWDKDLDVEDEDDYEENHSGSLVLFLEDNHYTLVHAQPSTKIIWPFKLRDSNSYYSQIEYPPNYFV
jgi:hypothetical protein